MRQLLVSETSPRIGGLQCAPNDVITPSARRERKTWQVAHHSPRERPYEQEHARAHRHTRTLSATVLPPKPAAPDCHDRSENEQKHIVVRSREKVTAQQVMTHAQCPATWTIEACQQLRRARRINRRGIMGTERPQIEAGGSEQAS